MKIKIKITKEIYYRAMDCGTGDTCNTVSSNCAVALAIREIAPKAKVYTDLIAWKGEKYYRWKTDEYITRLPQVARHLIVIFDNSYPMQRLQLPEFSFEVEFPDSMVEQIGINEVEKILETSETLSCAI